MVGIKFLGSHQETRMARLLDFSVSKKKTQVKNKNAKVVEVQRDILGLLLSKSQLNAPIEMEEA